MSHLVPPVSGGQAESFVLTPATSTVPTTSAQIRRVDVPPEVVAPIPDASAPDASAPDALAPIALAPIASAYFRVKPWIDRMVTCVLLIPATPLMLVTAAAILVFDGKPVFYRQTRVGKGGRTFQILKFRSMSRDAEQATGPVWAGDHDRRITPLGRWLRRSHLDELPQLINVVRGEMNLIGPRPERPEFVDQLAEQIPRYHGRLAVRPGITGLAQLRLGYDRSVADVARKVEIDLSYIESASASTDGKLLLHTVPYLVSKIIRPGGRPTRDDRSRVAPSPPALDPPTTPSPER